MQDLAAMVMTRLELQHAYGASMRLLTGLPTARSMNDGHSGI